MDYRVPGGDRVFDRVGGARDALIRPQQTSEIDGNEEKVIETSSNATPPQLGQTDKKPTTDP